MQGYNATMRRQLATMEETGAELGEHDLEAHAAALDPNAAAPEVVSEELRAERVTFLNKVARQLNVELEQNQQAAERYNAMLVDLQTFKKSSQLKPEQKLLLNWYAPLATAIEAEQKRIQQKEPGKDRSVYGPYLMMLDADRIAVIALHEVLSTVLLEDRGVAVLRTAIQIGRAICGEVINEQYKREKGITRALRRQYYQDTLGFGAVRPEEDALFTGEGSVDVPGASPSDVAAAQEQQAQRLGVAPELSDDVPPPTRKLFPREELFMQLEFQKEWSSTVCAKVGAFALQALLDNAVVPGASARHPRHEYDSGKKTTPKTRASAAASEGSSEEAIPAFTHVYKRTLTGKRKATASAGTIVAHPAVREQLDSQHAIQGLMSTCALPMVVPPLPWTSMNRGGYIRGRDRVMRMKGSEMQASALRLADTALPESNLAPILGALNYLGKVPWTINAPLIPVMEALMAEGKGEGDLPLIHPFPIPEFDNTVKDRKERRAMAKARKQALKRNAESHSLRCDHQLKMEIARSLRKEEEIYFPYNLDFRGRVYPMPPNLNHLGSDICRGLLKFKDSKPLGERGLHWLKVHLSNLMGNDKCSFDERREYTEANMEHVFDSADAPLDGDRWWLAADKPWQALTTCVELAAAMRSDDPLAYESSLPVHQDGSCNGLQHYAALGRDREGGAAVNLVKGAVPGDIYSRIKDKVVVIVEEDARRELANDADEKELSRQKIARVLCSGGGLISRKVVKQTVMTSVYGVTFVGARKQIGNRLKDLADDGKLEGLDEHDEYLASCYLANLTLGAIDEMFDGANRVKDWLTSCAHAVATEGQPISWLTPIGLPVVQPYRQSQRLSVQTVLQKVVVASSNDDCPVHRTRQTSAFPPNYVHSLDSTHMMMTAIECEKVGMTFTAVHDSYWTHACDVDEMNEKLRDAFVELHEKPLLEELRTCLALQYPGLDIPPVPARGNLDLNDVRDSEYFFN